MTVREAARKVLEAAAKPLHYKTIAARIQAHGLCRLTTKTPEATVGATLYEDIKAKGDKSEFVRYGKGMIGLQTAVSAVPVKKVSLQKAVTKVRPATSLSFTDSAEKVLSASANRAPLHYKDITDTALKGGFLKTEGKTPEASMYAQIHMEIERFEKRGIEPRFVKLGKGLFALSKWQPKGLAAVIAKHNRKILNELRERVSCIDPGAFEELVGQLLAELGFVDIEVTARYKDGGIDVRGTMVTGESIKTKMAVQVKRWKDNVGAPEVQKVRGSLGAHEIGLLVTTSDFTRKAREEAERADTAPIGLMNGEQLMALLAEYEIGIVRGIHSIFELDEHEAK